jgi:voltage-dependent calcium channel L type alpha-1F
MLNAIQSVTQDGYVEIIWRSFQSEPEAVWAFVILWVLFTLIGTWMLLGIFVAVVTGSFASVRRKQDIDDAAKDKQHHEEELQAFQDLSVESQAQRIRKLSREKHDKSHLDALREAHEANVALDRWAFRKSRVTIQDEVQEINAESQEEEMLVKEDLEQSLVRCAHSLLAFKSYARFKSFLICMHAIAIAGDQYDAPYAWLTNARVLHYLCNIFFTLDIITSMLASQYMYDGPDSMMATFAKTKRNIFELLITSIGVLGLITNIKVCQVIPALRIYILLQYLPTLHHILIMAIGTAKPLCNIMVFSFVCALAVGVMGKDILGNRMDFVRWNFSSFPEAMITVFQIFTGDGWSQVLYDAMKAQEDAGENPYLPPVLIIAWFLFSFVFISNLLVAVIIEAFDIAATMENCGKPGHIAALRREFSEAWRHFSYITKVVASGEVKIDVHDGVRPYDPFRRNLAEGVEQRMGKLLEIDAPAEIDAPKLKSAMAAEDKKEKISYVQKLLRWAAPNCDDPDPIIKTHDQERVLCCISAQSRIRRLALWVGDSSAFEGLVLAAITTSCFFLFIMPPCGLSSEEIMRIDPDFNVVFSDRRVQLVNYFLTGLFTVELLVRVLSRGLYFTERAYLKDGWNVMDAVIVGFSWLEVIFDLSGSQLRGAGGKVVRLARALRPLRVMKRNPSMRAILGALLGTLRPVAYVILFQMVTLFIFALIGMGMFGGLYKYCNTGKDFEDQMVAFPAGKLECVSFFVTNNGVMFPRSWDNPNYHFDSLPQAVKALFVVQNYPFVDIMHASMDVTAQNLNPSRNHSMSNAIFFIVYVFVGGIFVLNLFVAFIVDGFYISNCTTDADIFYSRFQKLIIKHRPQMKEISLPRNPVSTACRSLMENPWWQRFSLLCVTINVTWNLTEHADSPAWFDRMILLQNQVFDTVLFFEVMMNVIGFGPRGFVYDRWKAFDLLVAMGAIVGYASGDVNITRFAKAFRLVRILRLMIRIKSMKLILETALACMLEFVNILVLLWLVYSIFAVLFIQSFGLVKYGERLGNTAQFYTYGSALWTIFQIVGGDAWELMMSDCSVEWPRCTLAFNEENVNGWTAWKGKPMNYLTDCGDQLKSFVMFVILKCICQQIMLNLCIGMILKNFSCVTDSNHPDERWSTGPSIEQIETSARCYFLFCQPRRKITIRLSDLRAFLSILPLPIGFRKADGTLIYGPWERAAVKLIRAELNVLLRDKQIDQQNDWTSPFKHFWHTDNLPIVLVSEVDYVSVLSISIFWRKPDMVPVGIQNTRKKRVKEVLRMTYALVMANTLSTNVAQKTAARTRLKLEAAIHFRQWEQTDAVRCRHKEECATMAAAEKVLAKLIKGKPIDLYRPPCERIRGILKYVLSLPEDLVTHHEMFTANFQHKRVVTLQSMEIFREFCRTHLVVLRDIHTNTKNTGYFIGDLTHLNCQGWSVKNNPHDAFLMPVMRRTIDSVISGLDYDGSGRGLGTHEILQIFKRKGFEITVETADQLMKEGNQVTKEADDDEESSHILEQWTAIDLFMITNDERAENLDHALPLGSIVNVQSYCDTGKTAKQEGIRV